MAKLIYAALLSVDGYTEDESGGFAWAQPSDEVHAFINELERSVGTYLYGRRMYETMVYWETAPSAEDSSQLGRDFADIWRAADKVVYSRTLAEPSTPGTRLEREFEPDAVRRLKAATASDISVGGPELAAQAFEADLVDECHLFLVPVVVGGGKRALPDGVALGLHLLDERRFANGTVFLRYRVSR